jgi:hypothetical protein
MLSRQLRGGETKNPKHNSDGAIIKCLQPTQDRFVTSPRIYARKLCIFYKMLWHPDSFVSWDSIVGAVGQRAGALFFDRHLDHFIVTRNSHPSPGLGTIKTNYRDPKLSTHLPGLAKNAAPRR